MPVELPASVPTAISRYAFMYLPSGWDAAWQAALKANSGTVVGFGTSQLQAAINCTDCMNLGYFPLLRANILARNGITWRGDCYSVSYSTNWLAALNGTLPWVCDLAPTSWGYRGPGFSFVNTALNNGANPMYHFTTPANPPGAPTAYPRSAGLWHWDGTGASGNVVYNVNGGASQNLALAGDNTFKLFAINGLNGAAASTINFMSQPGNSFFSPVAMDVYPGSSGSTTTGIFFTWWAFSACPLHEFGRGDKVTPVDRFLQWKTGAAPAWKPDLAIFDVGNDFGYYYLQTPKVIGSNPSLNVYGYSPTLFHNKMQRLANAMRAGKPPTATVPLGNAVSIFLSASPYPDADYADVTAGTGAQNYETYLNMFQNFASEKNAGAFNGHTAVGEFGATLGYQTAGDVHLTNAGHVFMRDQLLVAGI